MMRVRWSFQDQYRGVMNSSKAYPRMFAAHSSLQESRQRTNLNEHSLQSIEPCRGHCHLRTQVATPSPVRVGLCVGLPKSNNTLYLIEACDSYTYNVPTSFLYGVVISGSRYCPVH